MSLTAWQLGVNRGGRPCLRGVSLSLAPGEVLAIIGPNGAGKSTLLHCLSGVHKPDRGRVCLDGLGLASYAPMVMARRRSVLPQASLLSFPLSALEVVLLGRSPHQGRSTAAQDLDIAAAVMAETATLELAERAYTSLSGGERQRVDLARALAQVWPDPADPASRGRFLLLDEPTNNLDLAHQHGLLRLARRLAGDGLGVCAVLHDPNLAALYADRVLVLCAGSVRALDAPELALTAPLLSEVFGLRVRVGKQPGGGAPLVYVPSEQAGAEPSASPQRCSAWAR